MSYTLAQENIIRKAAPVNKEIAEKLKIPTVNGDGKKLKKADLYNLIKQKI